MKRINKALLLLCSLFLAVAFPGVDMQAQSVNSAFEGTWVLDSVQVKEVMPNSIVEKTVLPGGKSKFNEIWMWKFTLKSNEKASYVEESGNIISDIPFRVDDMNDNSATIIFTGITNYKKLNIQLLSDKTMLITDALSSKYNLQDIDISWKMFYHKTNQ